MRRRGRRSAARPAVREAFAAGATDYLMRPIKPALLRARIRGWLQRRAAG